MRRALLVTSVIGIAAFSTGAAQPAPSAFPGENGKIAFARRGSIYVVNANGTGVATLVRGSSAAPAQTPAWSPDGSRIAFARACSIYVVRATGAGMRRLTRPSIACAVNPSWSPDGKRLTFVRQRHLGSLRRCAVHVMNADGTRQSALTEKRLTRNSACDDYPAWSPDGATIAFVRNEYSAERSESAIAIWFMNADGTGQKRITHHAPATRESMPTWSPDGSKLAFARIEDSYTDVMDVFVMNADGTGEQNVTHGSVRMVGTNEGRHAAWSPDGRRLALSGGGISVMNVDGTARTWLTRNGADDALDWQPLQP